MKAVRTALAAILCIPMMLFVVINTALIMLVEWLTEEEGNGDD